MNLNYRNLIILTLSSTLGVSVVAGVVLVGGILGAQLAPTPLLSTLPVSLLVVGTALATLPAGMLMQRIGRRWGFIASSLVAALGALLAVLAISVGNFVLFCLALLLIGLNSAFLQQYRFAVAESVPAKLAGRAVSFLFLGGVVAGILGPQLARWGKDWLALGEYTGSFALLGVVYALVIVFLLPFREVSPPADPASTAAMDEKARPLLQVILQPAYLTALLAGVAAYGVMSFIMTATPVHMHHIAGFSLSETSLVIQSHIIAMFLPSLFTGFLIDRLGVQRVMLIGLAALFACVLLGVTSRAFLGYWGALVLLGVGWNLLFVGATLLLTRSYLPAERFKAQAFNDFAIFSSQALLSLSAGAVLFRSSWDILNLINLPLLTLVLMLVLFSARRTAQPASAPQEI